MWVVTTKTIQCSCRFVTVYRLSEIGEGDSVKRTVRSWRCVDVCVGWLPWAELQVDGRQWDRHFQWSQCHSHRLFIRSRVYSNWQRNRYVQCIRRSTWPRYDISPWAREHVSQIIWQKAASATCHPRGCEWIRPILTPSNIWFLEPTWVSP